MEKANLENENNNYKKNKLIENSTNNPNLTKKRNRSQSNDINKNFKSSKINKL